MVPQREQGSGKVYREDRKIIAGWASRMGKNRRARLPETRDSIPVEDRINADERYSFDHRLRNEKPIKWVFVVEDESFNLRDMREAYRQ